MVIAQGGLRQPHPGDGSSPEPQRRKGVEQSLCRDSALPRHFSHCTGNYYATSYAGQLIG